MSETAVAAASAAPKPSMKAWWTLVKTSVSSWLDDYAPSMGAALSYYTVFSLAPLLLIVVRSRAWCSERKRCAASSSPSSRA